MNIRIVNIRTYIREEGEVLIRVDRSSVVGNPFYLQHEGYRNEVCNKYDAYFDKQLHTNKPFANYIQHIIETLKTNNVALGCFCVPKRCHAETIMRYIKEVN